MSGAARCLHSTCQGMPALLTTRAPNPLPPPCAHFRRAHKLRQVRPFHGPTETQRLPLTGLQDLGFLSHEAIKEKRWVKNHCAETKFKCELLKAGIYY